MGHPEQAAEQAGSPDEKATGIQDGQRRPRPLSKLLRTQGRSRRSTTRRALAICGCAVVVAAGVAYGANRASVAKAEQVAQINQRCLGVDEETRDTVLQLQREAAQEQHEEVRRKAEEAAAEQARLEEEARQAAEEAARQAEAQRQAEEEAAAEAERQAAAEAEAAANALPEGETRQPGDAVAWLAVQVAATASPGAPLTAPGNAWSRLDDSRLYNEYAVCDATLGAWGGNEAVASCAQAVAMVVAATIDPDTAPMAVSESHNTTLAYFSSHPDLYQEITGVSVEELQPGDILNNGWHVAIYVGNELAQTKFPGTDGNMFEAHYEGVRYPAISAYGSIGEFRVFRPLKYNTDAAHGLLDYESLVS